MLLSNWPTVTETEHDLCEFHKKNPGQQWPGCTCFSKQLVRKKTLEEFTTAEKAIHKMNPYIG